ncbi:hypothetical protein HanIR_Chr10g0496521 [Helianthus annuus]|nr:hypothetical protein HanIR_Chr10g0496521 [Helianthus annuus]
MGCNYNLLLQEKKNNQIEQKSMNKAPTSCLVPKPYNSYKYFSKSGCSFASKHTAKDTLLSLFGLGRTYTVPSYNMVAGPIKMGRPHPKSASCTGSLVQAFMLRFGLAK